MKKIAGYFFQKPLVLEEKKSFEIHLPTDTLYDGPLDSLHSFFVISEISDVG